MIGPLAKCIDWSAIQVLFGIEALFMPKAQPNGSNLRLEEALQFLKGPNFISAESPPARVEFTDPLRFRFQRRDRASSWRTTLFMAGFTAARNAGRNGRSLFSWKAPVTTRTIISSFR